LDKEWADCWPDAIDLFVIAVTAAVVVVRQSCSRQIAGELIENGLVLAVSFIGGWATSTSHARVATPAGDPLNPSQIMTSAKNLPTEEFADYTFVFN
jgi:hypothetical protein